MTKKKAPSKLETAKPPAVPRNAMQRSSARQKGLITGFLKNRKRGAPLKNKANLPKKKWMTRTSPKASPTPTSTTTVTITTTPTSTTTVTTTTTTDAASSANAAGTAAATTSQSKLLQKHSAATSKVTPPTPATRGKYKNWRVEPYKSALAHAIKANLKGLIHKKQRGR